jgi:hypothetical protein
LTDGFEQCKLRADTSNLSKVPELTGCQSCAVLR